MSKIVRLEKPPTYLADPDGFIATETAHNILRSIGLVRSINSPATTMISGGHGIGKTKALQHYYRSNHDTALYISIANRAEFDPEQRIPLFEPVFSARQSGPNHATQGRGPCSSSKSLP
ncbi:hypothetical protein [Pseudorhodobacter sp.]|uniref:hypothetical protein n=1 Tax=Pseudorhodobacter sp. TaxID=1934400 RepID=UPI002648CDE3|nr:hypothetical protein [Pseudorhodobacter sp.]MDN5787118.1 hypothetical protein [Pseudorhodobacter sp.]